MILQAKARLQATEVTAESLGIGSVVELTPPIRGHQFGRVDGFKLPNGKMAPVPGMGLTPVGKVGQILVELVDDRLMGSGDQVELTHDQLKLIDEREAVQILKMGKDKKPYRGVKVSDPNALVLKWTVDGKPVFTVKTDLEDTEIVQPNGKSLDIFDIMGEQYRSHLTRVQAEEKFQEYFRRFTTYKELLKSMSRGGIFRLGKEGKFRKAPGTGIDE